jgi:hypothetical protein
MDTSLVEVELIPAEGDELGHPQPIAIGQENLRVIAEPLSTNTAGSLAQAVECGGSEVRPGPDVGVCVALGKGESRHADLLSTELSWFRWLELQRTR